MLGVFDNITSRFFDYSSRCILNFYGHADEYRKFNGLFDSMKQFYGIIRDIVDYVDGVDPRLFLIDRDLESQDKFDSDSLSYVKLIINLSYKYTNREFVSSRNDDLFGELIGSVCGFSRYDPDKFDKAIVCSPEQFKDIRKEYLEKGKVNLDEILKKDYSINPIVDSIWL